MKKQKEEIRQYYFVIKQLVSREIKRKYARSFLGIIWSVLNPLMYMAVMSMIFTTMFRRSIENYPIYFLTGMTIWQLFSGATNSAMNALVDNRMLLIKLKLPKQVFVLSRIYTAFINFAYTCIAYIMMLVVFRVKFSFCMLLFPIAIFFLLLFSMGIGYLLSIVYVFFADIKYLYSVILTLWMYLSAIFYPVDSLTPLMKTVIEANPVYVYIAFARECVMYQSCPEPGMWMKMIAWGIGSFFTGYYVFKRNENKVMQKI